MPLYIDTKYINLVSPRLERFHWKKTSLAVCRCPVCGDSSKTKSKVRFYFYEKGGEFFVRCHNCDYSTTLGGFLKRMDGNLHRQYCFETLMLHRIEINIIPRNQASLRVVQKIGLRHEGVALRYLEIDGVWEDHSHFAITAEEWAVRAPELVADWLLPRD